MADQKAILKAGDKEIELPILSGTAGQDVIDIRALGKHGYFTFDPGRDNDVHICSAETIPIRCAMFFSPILR